MTAPHLHLDALNKSGQDIVNGIFAAGAVLTLADLERRFLVSRTVAREIMRVLESLGMVRSRRRVGITIRPRQEWNALDPLLVKWRLNSPERAETMLELMELRAALQPAAASLAARYATAEQRARLLELADRVGFLSVRPERQSEFVDAVVDFHSLLLRSSANELFATVADLIRLAERPADSHGHLPADARSIEHYRRIAIGIASGDDDAARRASLEQVARVLAGARRSLQVTRPTLEERPGVEGWSV
ncbi:MAG: FCD domain-containing protein [Micropruina sp.]